MHLIDKTIYNIFIFIYVYVFMYFFHFDVFTYAWFSFWYYYLPSSSYGLHEPEWKWLQNVVTEPLIFKLHLRWTNQSDRWTNYIAFAVLINSGVYVAGGFCSKSETSKSTTRFNFSIKLVNS